MNNKNTHSETKESMELDTEDPLENLRCYECSSENIAERGSIGACRTCGETNWIGEFGK